MNPTIQSTIRQAIAAVHTSELQLAKARKGMGISDYRNWLACNARVKSGSSLSTQSLLAYCETHKVSTKQLAAILITQIKPLGPQHYPLARTKQGALGKLEPTGRPTLSDSTHATLKPLSKSDAELALSLALNSAGITEIKNKRKFSNLPDDAGWRRSSSGSAEKSVLGNFSI